MLCNPYLCVCLTTLTHSLGWLHQGGGSHHQSCVLAHEQHSGAAALGVLGGGCWLLGLLSPSHVLCLVSTIPYQFCRLKLSEVLKMMNELEFVELGVCCVWLRLCLGTVAGVKPNRSTVVCLQDDDDLHMVRFRGASDASSSNTKHAEREASSDKMVSASQATGGAGAGAGAQVSSNGVVVSEDEEDSEVDSDMQSAAASVAKVADEDDSDLDADNSDDDSEGGGVPRSKRGGDEESDSSDTVVNELKCYQCRLHIIRGENFAKLDRTVLGARADSDPYIVCQLYAKDHPAVTEVP